MMASNRSNPQTRHFHHALRPIGWSNCGHVRHGHQRSGIRHKSRKQAGLQHKPKYSSWATGSNWTKLMYHGRCTRQADLYQHRMEAQGDTADFQVTFVPASESLRMKLQRVWQW